MRKIIGAGIAVFAVAMLILVTQLGTSGVRADVDPATIDFGGLAEGAIVGSVSCAANDGISCTADPGGSVGVFGSNPTFPAATNTAQIFDSECLPGGIPSDCSGGDDDLLFPGQGNMLIICEEQGTSNTCKLPPDDADEVGAFFEFDFSTWGPGTVCVDSITYGDVEAKEPGGEVELIPSGLKFAMPPTGDNVLDTVIIEECGVTSMVVSLNGSGAIDNIEIELEDRNGNGGGEGCTPGFWKNHEADWVGLSPGDSFETVFGTSPDPFPGDPTLADVFDLNGGGIKKLSQHALAALLNALHPDVDYDLTPAEVIADYQAALAAGGSAINDQKDIFEGFNELGCDVDN